MRAEGSCSGAAAVLPGPGSDLERDRQDPRASIASSLKWEALKEKEGSSRRETSLKALAEGLKVLRCYH